MITLFEEAGDAGSGGGGGQAAPAAKSLLGDAANGSPTPDPAASGGKSAVAETWWKGYFKEDGTIDKARLSHLPDEMKGDKALFERFNKVDDLFKSYAHHARLAREKGLAPLRDGASETEVSEHLAKIARANNAPEKWEGYGLKKPEGVADGLWDQTYADSMAKVFHKYGLSPKAVSDITSESMRLQQETLATIEADNAKAQDDHWKAQEKALRDAFGPYKEQRLKEAVAGARWMGLDPSDPIFSQNAALIIAAAKVASKISEAKFVDGSSELTTGKSAESEITAIANDPSHKYYDIMRNPSKNPRLYEEAIAYRRKLIQQVSAERDAAKR